jgi:uncharacterized protein YdeI (YjbR/CyaY-like superfamily)
MAEDARVSAYIEGAADFAKPILTHLRAVMHGSGVPLDEDIKWGMPAFVYRGKQICNFAAFKAHVALAFWRREAAGGSKPEGSGMGEYGRIRSLADLPADAEIVAAVKRAAALVDEGAKAPRSAKARAEPAAVPADLEAALAAVPAAAAVFAAFPPGARRDYVDWVVTAKQEATRARRIAQAVEWIAEGKKRHWKYEAC